MEIKSNTKFPNLRLGQAALKGLFNFEHEALNALNQFINILSQEEVALCPSPQFSTV